MSQVEQINKYKHLGFASEAREGWRHEWILQPILCGKISHKLGDVSFQTKP